MTAPRPFPSPLQAVLLWFMGIFLMIAVTGTILPWMSPTGATGFGAVIGLGVTGAIGAASIPSPHGVRVGLRGFAARHLVAVLLLLPTALLASEVDNLVKAVLPAPDAAAVAQEVLEKLPSDTQLDLVETLVVAVGLVPLVEEWFFRGVLQQGLVATSGARWGIALTSVLFALGHGLGTSPQAWAAAFASALALGLVFGTVRHATGSVYPGVILHALVNGLGVLALALPDVIVIPGYDAPGAHTPLVWLVPSLASVSLGLWLLGRERPEPVPPLPLVTDRADD